MRESKIKFEIRIREYQKTRMRKEATGTVSALPLMARRHKDL